MRLNCTIESKDYKNRYHCVATRDRSQLVEFCYPQTRSIYGIGQCVIFDSSFFLDNYTCLHFTYGCPDEHYFTDELYNYPSCFRIEPVLKCFMSEEKCRKNRATTTERKEVSTSQTVISQNHTIQEQEGIHLVPVLAPLITILGIISGIVVFATIMWKRKRCKIFFRRKHPGINDNVNIFENESLLNNEHDGKMLQLHNFNQENTDRKDSITLPEDQVGLENDPDISENSNRNKEITITTDKYHQDDAMYTKCIHEEGLKKQKTSDEHGGEMLLLHNVNQEHTNRKENITLSEEHVCLENDPDISENWNANKAMTITTDKYHQEDAMYTEYIHEVLKEQKKKDYGFLQYKRRQDFALNLCKTSYLQSKYTGQMLMANYIYVAEFSILCLLVLLFNIPL
ncbi:uncharacterized protein LOC134247583 [Saccostrea cucullata]|uniref:uncharacterized protein LOC134247583 n=1 Tax=Saccostrea cuccullata TaxID=36930 RepID=UPI002ED19F1C